MRLCVLGNGNLYLGFDPEARTREMFWPVVGLTNHVAEGTENKCLIWYNGGFHDVGGSIWHTQGKYGKGMCFNWRFNHKLMPLSVRMSDCVDPYSPVWARSISVDCPSTDRLGLYFKQYYHMGENTTGECGFFDPQAMRLYHYKGLYWVAIAVTLGQGSGTERLKHRKFGAVAKKRDGGVRLSPEAGEVFGRPIDHGLIESICGIACENPEENALNTLRVTYFLAFGRNRQEADLVLDKGLELGFTGICRRSAKYWCSRLGSDEPGCFYSTSIKVVTTHCDRGGGILASCDTEIMHDYRDHYRYVWPRDAAMCASSLLKSKLPEYARRYLKFCVETLPGGGFFWQRYRPDGTRGSGWHSLDLPAGELPVQEDEVALSLVTALDYMEETGDLDFIKETYRGFVEKAARFIQEYRTESGLLVKPSFDLWEERRGIFSFTQAVSALALMAAAKIAWALHEKRYVEYCAAACQLVEGLAEKLSNDELGFCRGVTGPASDQDWTEDASLFMVPVFLRRIEALCDGFPSLPSLECTRSSLKRLTPRSICTWNRLEKALLVQAGANPNGIARYAGDWYWRPEGQHNLPGNPWFVTTAWHLISGYSLKILSKEQVINWLDWFRRNSLGSDILAEQINGFTGAPLSVAPLIWSHSAYIDVVNLIQAETKPHY